MDFLRRHKNICSVVATLMVAVLVVYSYGSFRSYAASPEVSTLPADIDIDVTYDADTVNFTYAGKAYSIDRKHKVNLTHYRYSSNRYVRDDNYPEFFEYRFDGHPCYTSYWFSPSEMRVYVLIGWSSCSKVKSYLPSFKYGTFRISETDSDIYYYMTTIDYGSGSAIYNKMASKEAIDYWDAQVSSYDDSRNRSSDNVYACRCNLSSFNYYYTSYLKDGFLVRTYMDYKASGELDTSDYASNYHYIPNDLLCLFSNYEISGFYEPDTSKVNTPDYYFAFQYIFYKEGYGYIFVDSAKRCKMVGFPNGVTNPRFYFDGAGNNYVYTSADGITWILKSAYNTMYNSYFEVACGYEFTDYTLVYTNDKNFGGDPLVTPDWGDFSDVIEKLPDITDVYDNLLSHKTDKQTTALTGINKFMYNIASGLTSNIGLGGLYDSIVSSIKGDSYTYSLSEYMLTNLNNDLSVSLVYDYAEIDGEAWEVPRVTLYGYIVHIDKTLNNLLSNFNNLINISDSRLKSIYQNITLSNQYLRKIFDNLNSLSIPAAAPDYSSQFDKLSAALDKLHNDLIYEEGVTKLPNVPQYLVYIYGVTKDIRTRLDTIISKMPTGSGSVDVDTDSIVTAINESATSLTATVDSGNDKLHSDLNYIKALMTIDTVNKLFGDDNDSQNIFNFVSKGISSIVTGSIISDALAFSTNTKDGIIYISSYVNKFYDAVPVYSAVVTVSASFFIIDMVLRRRS